MAFVNLPPNLQDMFYGITDRIAKLETGPNQAMYTAEEAQLSAQGSLEIALTAQSVATQAEIQAINASIQATIAQSQATLASSQATVAQQSANGKNTIYYGTTATPNTATITGAVGNGSVITYNAYNGFVVGQTVVVSGINPSQYNVTGVVTSASFTQFRIASVATGTYLSGGSALVIGLNYKVGDLYFQYNTSSQVIAQFTWNGTSWQTTPITNAVITNLDAGKITTGIITSIEYNNGSGTFRVTPAGALTASSANITGTVNAQTGTFGNTTTGNYWSIGSSGLTAVGTGTITGGLIQGSSITVPNSNAWKFAVDSAGSLQAVNANITGTITATSGSFTGTVNANAGTIAGFTLSANTITAPSSSLVIYSNGTIQGGNSQTLFYGYVNIGGGTAGTERLIVTGNSSFDGTIVTTGAATINGELRAVFGANNTTTSAANTWMSTTGQLRRVVSSSIQYKENIVNLTSVSELDPSALYDLPVRAFRYKLDHLSDADDRAGVLIPGFIAEEMDAIYPIAVDYSEGVESWNDRLLVPALLALIQNQDKRIKLLEGK
jgi:trimeric autotransporter adhesin